MLDIIDASDTNCLSISYPNVTTIILPNGLLTIGDYAFFNMKHLTDIHTTDATAQNNDIYFPNLLKSFGKGCFQGCKNLIKNIHFGEKVKEICDSAFRITIDDYQATEQKFIFDDFDKTYLTKYERSAFSIDVNDLYVDRYKQQVKTRKVQFYPDAIFESQLMLHETTGGFFASIHQHGEETYSYDSILKTDRYYNSIQQIANETTNHLYLSDSQLKYMLKYNVILSKSELFQVEFITNKINDQSSELTNNVSKLQLKVDNLQTMIFIGSVILTTTFVCNMVVLYKRK